MLAVILAAGVGSRLMPLTQDIPKPMLDINGKPFLSYVIDVLKKNNIKDIIICVGYRKESIIDYFGDGKRFGVTIRYSISKILGTAGEVKNASKLIGKSDFIVLNGDTLLDIDMKKAIEFHKKSRSIATILLTNIDNSERYGSVLVEEGFITRFLEKEKKGTGIINAGVYILNNEVLSLMPDEISSFETDIFPRLSKEKRLKGILTEGYFIDIGTFEDLKKARDELKVKT